MGISVSISVSVNGNHLFPLTDISVSVFVNGKQHCREEARGGGCRGGEEGYGMKFTALSSPLGKLGRVII